MHNPIPPGDFTPLIHFRQQAYDLLDQRQDAFFELLDAVLQTPAARSFAELTLAPACQRQWPSSYKALTEVTYDQQGLDELCLAHVPDKEVAHFAIDVTSLRRMRSPTLLERQYCHGAAREVNGTGVIVGLPYSILAWTTARGSSFAPPVNIRRLAPGDKAVAVAVAQVCWLGFYLPSGQDWRAALDGGYGSINFFAPLQDKDVQVVARTRRDRVLYHRATAAEYCGVGRRPVFGAAFRCADPTTWSAPAETLSFTETRHGRVELQLWRGLGLRAKGQFVALDLLRSQIHAERDKPPKPHWYLAWNGKHEQTITARDWYDTITHRWGIEPGNRLRKDRLYADLPKTRTAPSSDHWLMAVQLLEWHLYLARTVVTQKCLPWQKPQAADALTPNRVLQSLAAHFSQLGTPVRPVRPRGNAPGWPLGKSRSIPARWKLTPKRRKKRPKVSKNE